VVTCSGVVLIPIQGIENLITVSRETKCFTMSLRVRRRKMIRNIGERGRINNILILTIFPQIWSLAYLLEAYTRTVHGAGAPDQGADVQGAGHAIPF